MQPDEKLLCSPEEKVPLEIANQADVIEFLADFVKNGRVRITESDVLAIHRHYQRDISLLWKLSRRYD